MSETTAKGRYAELKFRREPFLMRGRENAKLTIPSLLPPEGFNHAMTLPQPNQGFGARLCVNLASRLTTALMPPGIPHFKLDVPSDVLLQSGELAVPPELDRNLAMTEKVTNTEIERRAWRAPTYLSMLNLIVGGNSLEWMQPDNTIRVYRLDQYVVVRDPSGRLIELVIDEQLAYQTLSPEMKDLLPAREDNSNAPVHLYTWAKWDAAKKQWEVEQWLDDKQVPNTKGTYKVEPFWALRWSEVIGEDYGRSKVEEHYADLNVIDSLQKAVVDGAAMASRNVTMIRPNAAGGLNLRRRVSTAANGDVIIGNPEDVEMLQYENVTGMQYTSQELQYLKKELGAAFLLMSATTRDAERVTAQEIRQMAEELEGTLGGVYSSLAQEMTRKRLNRLIFQMQASNALPEWPEGMVEPTILTGIEALGREQDWGRVAQALNLINLMAPENQVYINFPALLSKGFTAIGLSDAVRSEEEAAQLRQQQAAMQALQQGLGAAAQGIAESATQPE